MAVKGLIITGCPQQRFRGITGLGTFKKKFLKVLLLGLAITILIVSWLAFGDRGFVYLYRMDRERQVYLERIKNLEAANQELRDEINRLQYDKEYIEATARKELGLLKKNEVVYKFTKEDKNSK